MCASVNIVISALSLFDLSTKNCMMWTPQRIINNKYDRIIALIDMDCFYCQVEEKLNPNLKGKPIIVQPLQYDDYGGGGIIALNYVAKGRGVKRSMRGHEARKQCPELELVRVPVIRGKADLSKYRNAGKQVAAVLQKFSPLMTRASVDEAYLDLTERVQNRLADMNDGKYALKAQAFENTFAVSFPTIGEYVQHVTKKVTTRDDIEENLEHLSEEDHESFRKNGIKLLIASSIVNEIRAEVKEKTGFECSAGVSHNKTLAKLVCGLNKPNKQTLLPLHYVQEFYRTLPIKKVQGLGGKFGDKLCDDLKVQYMAELHQFSKEQLLQHCDERNTKWLYDLARGIDLDPVTPRLAPKSISCSKMFPRQNALTDLESLNHWLHEIVKDVVERVDEDECENNRRAKQISVSFTQTIDDADVSSTRTINFTANNEEKIVSDAIDVIKRNTPRFFKSADENTLDNPIKFLGFNVCKFESLDVKRSKTIEDMFRKSVQKNGDGKIKEKAATDVIGPDDNEKRRNDFLGNYRVEFKEDDVDSSDGEYEKHAESDTPIETTNQINCQEHLLISEDLSSNASSYEQPTEQSCPQFNYSQCGEIVNESDMQVHMDGHLAFQLNEKHRTESKDQLKKQHSSNTSVNKEQKCESKKSSKNMKMASIQKFFVKKMESTAELSAIPLNEVEVERCAECNKTIPISDLFEHTDYHAAKRLREELMKSDVKTNRSSSSNGLQKCNSNLSSGKRKLSKKKTVNSQTPALRNISAFFRKNSESK